MHPTELCVSETNFYLELQNLEQERERLEQEQAIKLLELEEKRQKLAEAKLNELELTEDVSEAASDLLQTLSQLSVGSQQTTSQRISHWVNEGNNPVNQPQTIATERNAITNDTYANLLPTYLAPISTNNPVTTMRPASVVNSLTTAQKHSTAVTTDPSETIMRPNSTPPLSEGNMPLLLDNLPPPPPITKTPNALGPQAPTHTRNVPAATIPAGMPRVHIPASHFISNTSLGRFRLQVVSLDIT